MAQDITEMLAARVGRIKPSPTIAVSSRAQELKAAGRDVINLGSGEPDFDTPEHIKEAAVAAVRGGQTKYTPVGGTPALKTAAAEKLRRENGLDYPPEQICVSAGAKHCIMNLMAAVLDEGDEALIPAPYWVSYPDMVLLQGARPAVIPSPAQTRKITPEGLENALTEKSKLLILNSPCNPAGAVYSSGELAALAEVAARYPRLFIVSDDIYEHIIYGGGVFANILNVCPALAERTVVVNGVSKAYAMTGWRIGYAAGPAPLIRAMTKIQSQTTSNPCSIAQAAAVAALEGGLECTKPMLEAFERRRRFVLEGLNASPGISCGEIEGAFYAFADVSAAAAALFEKGKISAPDDLEFCGYLLEHAGVAAVPGSAFGAENCFRISFAASDDSLKSALARIQEALS